MAEHRLSKGTLWFHDLARLVVRTYGHIWHGVRVVGLEQLPKQGGVLVVSNHQSHLDPAFLSAFASRPIHFLAKEELFRVPVLKVLMVWMGMVSTPREGNASAAMRSGIRVIKDQHILGVFPEGTRSKTGERLPAQSGVVAIAALAGDVPIVPAYISGSFEALPPGAGFPKFRKPVTIYFGTPFQLSAEERNLKDKDRLAETAERIMDHVFALRPAASGSA